MYPSQFEYRRATSVTEALTLLQESGGDAKLIAGGHSLIPMLKLRLAQIGTLIDISRLPELQGVSTDGQQARIGALTTHAQVAKANLGVLSAAAREVGDMQVRNRGTIGGNIAHADPASDIPAAILALNATITVQGPNGERTVGVDDFFQGLFATNLGEDELITSISFPTGSQNSVGTYAKFANPASGYAVVGVAVSLDKQNGSVGAARVAVNGVLDHAVRLSGVEAALAGATSKAALEAAADQALTGLDSTRFMSDIHASADYRVHLLRVMTRRALAEVADLAGMS